MRRAAAHPGFSLVDLLIALAVLGIAGALVIPMAGGSEASKLRGAARMLIADLQYAQIESLSHPAAPRLVVFDPAQHAYRIAPAATPDVPVTNPIDKQPYLTRFGSGRARHLEGVQIAGLSLSAVDRVGFGAYGQLTPSAPAVITLSCGGATVTITLDAATGNATVSGL